MNVRRMRFLLGAGVAALGLMTFGAKPAVADDVRGGFSIRVGSFHSGSRYGHSRHGFDRSDRYYRDSYRSSCDGYRGSRFSDFGHRGGSRFSYSPHVRSRFGSHHSRSFSFPRRSGHHSRSGHGFRGGRRHHR